MTELLLKFLGPLLSPLVERVQARVQKFSTLTRIALVAIAVCGAILFYYGDKVPEATMDADRAARVLLAGSLIPLNAEARAETRDAVAHLSDELEAELVNPGSLEPPSAWTFAQLVASKAAIGDVDRKKVIPYFAEETSPLCHCWEETPGDGAPNLAVSGWVSFALASIKEPVADGYIEYVLEQQNNDGSWSVFRKQLNEDNRDYHSTFATAWTIIGLEAQLAANLVSDPTRPRVVESLKTATAWLISQRSSRSRWKNYPLNPYGVDSYSLSGLALHALHVADPNIAALERRWLDDLPAAVSQPSEAESSQEWFKTRDGRREDNFQHVKLPWLLIATADAYASGNLAQRIHALRWIERALDHRNMEGAFTRDKDWSHAELLLATQYVLSKSTR